MIKLTRQNHTEPDVKMLESQLKDLEKALNEVPYDDIKKSQELISEIVNFQDSDGSFRLVDSWDIQSDSCVAFSFVPTYLCSAILMKCFLADPDCLTGKEAIIFPRALMKCCENGLKGQGFDDIHGQTEAMQVFIKGGVFEFILMYPTMCTEFTRMILEIVNYYRSCILSHKCVLGYGCYETEFRKIVDAYDRSISGDYVWYACYGSNLLKERFMEYIKQCSDPTPPSEDRPYRIEFPMYFASSSKKWAYGGKAFLDIKRSGFAYGRIYKITREQFEEIKKKEGRDYNYEMYLGTVSGLEVLTFTNRDSIQTKTIPSNDYFNTIIQGLDECYSSKLCASERCDYLINAIFPGNTFKVARAIRESNHSITNSGICALTGLNLDKVTKAVAWLYDKGVIVQDTRSINAGHDISNPDAFFYTKDDPRGRKLVSDMIKCLEQAKLEDDKTNQNRYYLAYGSNLNLEQMMSRCPTAEKLGSGEIDGFRLMFKGGYGSGYLTIEEAPGFYVPVGVFCVSKDDEAALDTYEGFPYLYYKKEFRINMIDIAGRHRSIKAFAYIMHEDRKLASPSCRYVEIVKDGYRDFCFDESLINEAIDFSSR